MTNTIHRRAWLAGTAGLAAATAARADDAEQRKKGLEQAKRDMDLIAQIGGTKIAAPPVGATNQEGLSLSAAADRYRVLLELGQKMGVTPQVEVWGFSKSLHRLGETW